MLGCLRYQKKIAAAVFNSCQLGTWDYGTVPEDLHLYKYDIGLPRVDNSVDWNQNNSNNFTRAVPIQLALFYFNLLKDFYRGQCVCTFKFIADAREG